MPEVPKPIPTARPSHQIEPRAGKPNATITAQESLFLPGGATAVALETEAKRAMCSRLRERERRDSNPRPRRDRPVGWGVAASRGVTKSV